MVDGRSGLGSQQAAATHGFRPRTLRDIAGGKLKTTCDVCDITSNYQLFSYALRGFTLKLHFLRNVNPEASAYDRKFGPAYGLSLTLKPFHKF